MRTTTNLLIATLSLSLSLSLALTAGAQQSSTARPKYKRHLPKMLVAQAKISEDSARKLAIARVPNARIRAVELEKEDGKLIYSYEMKIAGTSGEEEVNVNAIDGSIVAVEHESREAEKAEKKAEKKEHGKADKADEKPKTP